VLLSYKLKLGGQSWFWGKRREKSEEGMQKKKTLCLRLGRSPEENVKESGKKKRAKKARQRVLPSGNYVSIGSGGDVSGRWRNPNKRGEGSTELLVFLAEETCPGGKRSERPTEKRAGRPLWGKKILRRKGDISQNGGGKRGSVANG